MTNSLHRFFRWLKSLLFKAPEPEVLTCDQCDDGKTEAQCFVCWGKDPEGQQANLCETHLRELWDFAVSIGSTDHWIQSDPRTSQEREMFNSVGCKEVIYGESPIETVRAALKEKQ